MSPADRYDRPTSSLEEIQSCVRAGRYSLVRRAEDDARRLGLLAAVPDCICALSDRRIQDGGHFFKSSEAQHPPPEAAGLWHDVYKVEWEGTPLYVKLQMARNGRTAVVISFHEDTSWREP